MRRPIEASLWKYQTTSQVEYPQESLSLRIHEIVVCCCPEAEQGIVLFAVESKSLYQGMSLKINHWPLSIHPLIAAMASARAFQECNRVALQGLSS